MPTANASAPDPQHSSTTTGCGGASLTACSSSSSVRRRGTNTPGSTAIRRPPNSAQPRICSSGIPRTRCRTICSSSSGVVAVVSSSSASSSANTQPAIRSLSASGPRPGGSSRRSSVVFLAFSEKPLELGRNLLRAWHAIRMFGLQRVVLLLEGCHELLNFCRG